MIPYVIVARNVNQALEDGLWHLKTAGVKSDSRNGPVIKSPGMVITHYKRPEERILWSPQRNANPFFHLMEFLWMLAGRNDVKFPAEFAKQMNEYAEEDGHIHGAYGYRWRQFFGFDQIEKLVRSLKSNSNTRRAVLQMWSCECDLGAGFKDIPCNTHAYFERRGNALDMTVCCRSNDIIWGAYGANAVHFSMLQQFIASAIGCEVGIYNQVSNNYHLYTEFGPGKVLLENVGKAANTDYYRDGLVAACTIPLIRDGFERTLVDIETFVNTSSQERVESYTSNRFLIEIAGPMREWWDRGDIKVLHAMPECDWKQASVRWAERLILRSATLIKS